MLHRFGTVALLLVLLPVVASAQSGPMYDFSVEKLFRLKAAATVYALRENAAQLNMTEQQRRQVRELLDRSDAAIDAAAAELRREGAPPERWVGRAGELQRSFAANEWAKWVEHNADLNAQVERMRLTNEEVYLAVLGRNRLDLVRAATKAGLDPSQVEEAQEIIQAERARLDAYNAAMAKREEAWARLAPTGQLRTDEREMEREFMHLDVAVQMQRSGNHVRDQLKQLLPSDHRAALDGAIRP